jgi:hypothetical protein
VDDFGIFADEFTSMVTAACAHAREEALRSGVSVFYHDAKRGIDVMEQADGRRFEIRFLPGHPRERDFQIVRELAKSAA